MHWRCTLAELNMTYAFGMAVGVVAVAYFALQGAINRNDRAAAFEILRTNQMMASAKLQQTSQECGKTLVVPEKVEKLFRSHILASFKGATDEQGFLSAISSTKSEILPKIKLLVKGLDDRSVAAVKELGESSWIEVTPEPGDTMLITEKEAAIRNKYAVNKYRDNRDKYKSSFRKTHEFDHDASIAYVEHSKFVKCVIDGALTNAQDDSS
jgi:hypothetical protein